MLCEVCQKREATCFVTDIGDGRTKPRKLCIECFGAESPAHKGLIEELRSARCQYCGGQPCSVVTDIYAMMMGLRKMKRVCLMCKMEERAFIRQLPPGNASVLSQQEQLAAIQRHADALDRHMREWVSQRNSN